MGAWRTARRRTNRAPAPRHIGALDVLERDRDASGRALAHPAMAQIRLVVVHPHRVTHPPALAAAGHRLGHASSPARLRSEEHTSELQSLMRISSAVFCWKKKKKYNPINTHQ